MLGCRAAAASEWGFYGGESRWKDDRWAGHEAVLPSVDELPPSLEVIEVECEFLVKRLDLLLTDTTRAGGLSSVSHLLAPGVQNFLNEPLDFEPCQPME